MPLFERWCYGFSAATRMVLPCVDGDSCDGDDLYLKLWCFTLLPDSSGNSRQGGGEESQSGS